MAWNANELLGALGVALLLAALGLAGASAA